jgi:hypothetical protein
MANEIAIWDKVLTSALNIPGTTVDRKTFLKTELSAYCSTDNIDEVVENPTKFVNIKILDKIADACIKNHCRMATAVSFVTGLPGGWGMLAAIPADMAQYYGHILVLAQKLAYIYGIPSLTDEQGKLNENARDILTVFVGVMMGAEMANAVVKNICKDLAIQAAKRIPRIGLMKTTFYPVIKEVCKWIGKKMTTKGFGQIVGKAIPIIGGIISAGITAASFIPSAKRLKNKLKEQIADIQDATNAS